jgi:hypothetical protein
MTKTMTVSALLGMAMAATAWAAGDVDANGDGVLTMDEVQAAYPNINAEAFTAMDVNADGTLDADEVAAAQQAGLMPPTEG